MEMLDRYLKTLRSALPSEQKDDIIRELSENIHSEIEDRETQLGRPLDESEMESLLRQHGNPLVVASRYRQDHRSLSFGRQLIGPTLFPFYAKVLSFNLGLTGAIILIIFVALLASGQSLGLGGALSTLFYNLLIQFSIITLIFSVMDRHLTKHPDCWGPRKPNAAHFPALTTRTSEPKVSRMESISQLVALAIFLVWLRAARSAPFLILGPAALFLKAAPVWRQLYAPLAVIALVIMIQSATNLFRPDWVRLRTFARVAAHSVTLVVCFFLIKAGTWVIAGTEASPNYQHAAVIINQVIFFFLLASVFITVMQLIRALRRLIAGGATPASTRSARH